MFKSAVILISSSVIAIPVGLLTAKACAVFLGAPGFGHLGLLQGLLSLGGIIFTLGIGAGFVQKGAHALGASDYDRFRALKVSGWLVTGAMCLLAVACLLVTGTYFGPAVLGRELGAMVLVPLAAALAFNLITHYLTAIINARGLTTSLAAIRVFTAFSNCVLAVVILAATKEAGIGLYLMGVAFAGCAVSMFFYMAARDGADRGERPGRAELAQATRDLTGFGVPYTLSMVVGAGVTQALPAILLSLTDVMTVGLYRAAALVSDTVFHVFSVVFSQDYYPRLSKMADRDEELVFEINQYHYYGMPVAAAACYFLVAISQWLMPVLFTAEFLPVVFLMQFLLLTCLVRFTTGTLSFFILARSKSTIYFATEALAGFVCLAGVFLLVPRGGLTGLGLAMLLTAIAHQTVLYILIRRELRFAWTPENLRSLLIVWGASGCILYNSAAGNLLTVSMLAAGATALACAEAYRRFVAASGGLHGLRTRVRAVFTARFARR